jgi:hypothetical protein
MCKQTVQDDALINIQLNGDVVAQHIVQVNGLELVDKLLGTAKPKPQQCAH